MTRGLHQVSETPTSTESRTTLIPSVILATSEDTYPPIAPIPRKQKAKAKATRAKEKGERDIREKVQAGAAKREVGAARREVGAARREEKQRAREKAMKAPVGIVFRLATSLSSASSKVSRECRTSRRYRRWVLQARTSCIRPLPFHSMAISSKQPRPHHLSRHSRIWDPIQDLFTYPMGGGAVRPTSDGFTRVGNTPVGMNGVWMLGGGGQRASGSGKC